MVWTVAAVTGKQFVWIFAISSFPISLEAITCVTCIMLTAGQKKKHDSFYLLFDCRTHSHTIMTFFPIRLHKSRRTQYSFKSFRLLCFVFVFFFLAWPINGVRLPLLWMMLFVVVILFSLGKKWSFTRLNIISLSLSGDDDSMGSVYFVVQAQRVRCLLIGVSFSAIHFTETCVAAV